jgi:hypothetical protein
MKAVPVLIATAMYFGLSFAVFNKNVSPVTSPTGDA